MFSFRKFRWDILIFYCSGLRRSSEFRKKVSVFGFGTISTPRVVDQVEVVLEDVRGIVRILGARPVD
jgi:hypothetical protein